MDRKLRIAIDCRIDDSHLGIGNSTLALAKAFSDSRVPDQEYTFIVREDMRDWLAPYVYGPCRLAGIQASRLSSLKPMLRRIAPLRLLWQKTRNRVAHVPVSDGYIESNQFDLVHFPTPMGYLTDLPSIYQPWDLQHLHYPQFFTEVEFELRERHYRAFCDRAAFVCVQAQWTKQDVINHYGIAEEKMVIIPWGSVFQAYSAPSVAIKRATVEKYGLPDRFFFYPAVTWPHKNHEVILRAIHLLKSEYGSTPHVYFTGASTEYRSTLEKLAQDLSVSDQIHFLGFLMSEELQVVFGAATAMVFPSKFEGFGLPILEAFQARLPVLSSNATTLPEVASDAALYFDPDSPAELASLMNRVLEVPEMRQELIDMGTHALSRYSMKDTATSFHALYKKTAALSSRDHQLHPVSTAVE